MLETTHDTGRKRRDVIIAVAVSILAEGAEAAILLSSGVHLSLAVAIGVQEVPLALVLVVLMTKWKWWRSAGWVAPQWRSLGLVWLPALLVVSQLAALRAVVAHHAAGSVALAFVAACMVGFVEESWFRGLLFGALVPRGVVFAAIVSSLIFGLFHTSWLVSGASPLRTLAEIGVAFALGIMFAAARYRTKSIWPVVVLHTLTDFPGLLLTKQQVLNSGALGSNVVFLVAIGLVYALILLRPSKRQVSL